MNKKKRVLAAAAMVGALYAGGAVRPAVVEATICFHCQDGYDAYTGEWSHWDSFVFVEWLKTHKNNKHSGEASGDCWQHSSYIPSGGGGGGGGTVE